MVATRHRKRPSFDHLLTGDDRAIPGGRPAVDGLDPERCCNVMVSHREAPVMAMRAPQTLPDHCGVSTTVRSLGAISQRFLEN